MSDSTIQSGQSGTMFAGADAVQLFQATVIKNAINLYLRTGMRANRAYTPANMLATASAITGKPYKNSRKWLAQAAFDLDVWCRTMASALPEPFREVAARDAAKNRRQ